MNGMLLITICKMIATLLESCTTTTHKIWKYVEVITWWTSTIRNRQKMLKINDEKMNEKPTGELNENGRGKKNYPLFQLWTNENLIGTTVEKHRTLNIERTNVSELWKGRQLAYNNASHIHKHSNIQAAALLFHNMHCPYRSKLSYRVRERMNLNGS